MTLTSGNSEIARAIAYLLRRDRMNVNRLSALTAIPASTLYAMLKKNTNEADIGNLKKIADVFGENVSIFCSLDEYVHPVELLPDEARILAYYRSMNRAGQLRLSEYAAEVGENPKYRAAENLPSADNSAGAER